MSLVSIEATISSKRRILGDGEWFAGHDLGDLAAVLSNVIGRVGTAHQKPEPAAALALRADLAATNEIAFRDDADELAGRIDHGKPADMVLAAWYWRLRGWWRPV